MAQRGIQQVAPQGFGKRRLLAQAVTGLISLGLVACDKVSKSDETAMYSYAIGLQVAQNLKRQNIPVDVKAFTAAMNDVMSDKKPQLTPEESSQALQKLATTMQGRQKQMHEEMVKKDQGEATENLKKGLEFLEQNKKKKGVVVTKTGLQYKILKEGKGKSPKTTDVVEVHYRGHLIDGKEFDSSYKRGTPAQFPVGQVIPGWTEALQLMKPGARYELFIPANLAYGPERKGEDIPPNSTLVFEVELIKITK